ncbi:hypothetical protein [Streptomyces sp. NBC_00094]|uniref:hypothetical protein n=1 Tax=Streptomyces sp. NBC_00094 TaxID=2903620 RepID=UPI00224E176F|nr:hypothetical protein [Streptomyces sp. NBC_00094]MCX5391973.1 hypothetical protein [Streptomyces sp. NBC_00094]
MQIRRWLPDQPTLIGRHDWPDEDGKGTHLRLRVGSIVVLDRRAWRVLEITGYPDNSWPKSYEKAWRDHVELWWHANELRRAENQAFKPAPERAEFYRRPVVLVLRDENLPRSAVKHWCAPASLDWQVLPEHYAVCRACGELPPCHHGEYCPEGGPRRPEQSGGIPLIVPEGCCMGCAEQIKPRMRTVRFPGPNLWYPDLGDDTAVFHARSSCEDQVEYYRAQWQSEYPQPAAHPTTPAFPGFDHLALPRARQYQTPAPAPQYQPPAPAPAPAPQYQPPASAPQHGMAPAPAPVPQHDQAQAPQHGQGSVPQHVQDHFAVPQHEQNHFAAPHIQEEAHTSLAVGSGAFSPSFGGYRTEPESYPSALPPPPQGAAPAPAAPPVVAGDAGPAVRAAEELSRSLTGRPVFHNAEQAARVIEELTAAVRNIALCLNDPQARTHP